VYYWVSYWDVTAGQTEEDASQAAYPLPAGTTSVDFEGLTPTNTATLAYDSEYGFYVQAENLVAYSDPSQPVLQLPTPVCAAGVLDSDSGYINFTAGAIFYLYVQDPSDLPDPGAVSFTDLNTNISQGMAIAPYPKFEVFEWEEGADPPISYKVLWDLSSDISPGYTVSAAYNPCRAL
jgi:hypothetical protein